MFTLAPPRPAVLNFHRENQDYRTGKPLTMWATAATLPSFLRFELRRPLLLRPRAACRRDDTVHPQVLDHLTVVILRMEGADNGDCETRGEKWSYGLGQWRDLVFGGDPGNGPMAERERIFKILHNFVLGFQRRGAVDIFFDGVSVYRLPHERAKINVIGEGDVLHLFSESAYAFKLAIRRREGILVFGHSFSSGYDFLLDNAIEHVEDRSDGGRL